MSAALLTSKTALVTAVMHSMCINLVKPGPEPGGPRRPGPSSPQTLETKKKKLKNRACGTKNAKK